MDPIYIIKIGGNITDEADKLSLFIQQFSSLDTNCILVHGGGKMSTRIAEKMNIPVTMVAGRRITDEATLQVAVMVYAGWINKTISAKLTAAGRPAIGISGADMHLIKATKRPVTGVDYGYVGDVQPDGVATKHLFTLLNGGLTPVVGSVTCDANGQLLNTNADAIASVLARALQSVAEVKLIYCFEKDGVVSGDKVLKKLRIAEAESLRIAGVITDGMIAKLQEAFKAAEAGVKVSIGNADKLQQVILGENGTEIIP